MDNLISILGIAPSASNSPGSNGPGDGQNNASTVTVDTHANTLEGDYILLMAAVDWSSSLSPIVADGIDSWVLLGSANSSTTKRVGAWLGRVTVDGPRTVGARQSASSSVMQVQAWTLRANGGVIARDGGLSTHVGQTRPYNFNSITTSGDRSLVVIFHSIVQFSGTDIDYTTPAAPLTTGVERYWDSAAASISAYEFRSAPGNVGTRQLTSNVATLTAGAGVGLMFALRAEPTWTSIDPPASPVVITGPAPTIEMIDPTVRANPAPGPVSLAGPQPTLTAIMKPSAAPVAVSGPAPSIAFVVPTTPGVITVSGLDAFAGGLAPGPGDIRVVGRPVQIAYGGQNAASKTFPIEKPPPPPARVLAQNIRTGEWLHWDLPITGLSITKTLSGPQTISGEFPTEIADLRDVNLEPWGTWIHVEEGGIIRASGILLPAGVDQNERLTLDAIGISNYPHETPYLGGFTLSGTDPATGVSGVGVGLDPADIVRVIWEEVQRYPDSNLGVTVAGQTGVKIGTPPKDVEFETGSGDAVSFTAGPYSKLDWWEMADCGGEIDRLAKETSFDYVEREAWNSDKSGVDHWIEIGWPRLGREHNSVRLSQEDNLLAAIGPEEPDDRYASMVVVLGAGEGSSRILGSAYNGVGTRIRRVKTIDDKTIQSTAAANARARTELNKCQALQDVTECTISAHHPDAKLGSYDVGDDVPLTGEIPWVGWVNLKQRILSYTWTPASDSVQLTLRSSSSFTYGGTAR